MAPSVETNIFVIYFQESSHLRNYSKFHRAVRFCPANTSSAPPPQLKAWVNLKERQGERGTSFALHQRPSFPAQQRPDEKDLRLAPFVAVVAKEPPLRSEDTAGKNKNYIHKIVPVCVGVLKPGNKV